MRRNLEKFEIRGLHGTQKIEATIQDNTLILVGENGSGKTTLLNTIYGLKRSDKGTLDFVANKLSKTSIAYLETNNYFYQYITGNE